MRFVKRAVRGDLHRFKAYVELADEEPDGWRGKIEEGKVKRSRPRSSKSRNGSRSSNGPKAKSRLEVLTALEAISKPFTEHNCPTD